jgi:ferric-dicitrate binding protein FerR (iron transport regulator)
MDKIYNKILERSSGFKVKGNISKEEAWNKTIKKLNRNRFRKRLAYYAAAAILIPFIFIILTSNNKSFESPNGKNKVVYLPGSSKIILNAGSSVELKKIKFFNRWIVKLEGEAYFEIEKGQKMEIKCNRGEVKILGTSFNVFSRDNNFVVECYSGKVSVSNNKKTITLKPNTGSRLVGNSTKLEEYSIENEGNKTWIEGFYNFVNQPLKSVFNEFERQYDYLILYKTDITDRIYSGSFKNDNLENAIKTICLPMDLDYTLDKNKKTITIN